MQFYMVCFKFYHSLSDLDWSLTRLFSLTQKMKMPAISVLIKRQMERLQDNQILPMFNQREDYFFLSCFRDRAVEHFLSWHQSQRQWLQSTVTFRIYYLFLFMFAFLLGRITNPVIYFKVKKISLVNWWVILFPCHLVFRCLCKFCDNKWVDEEHLWTVD